MASATIETVSAADRHPCDVTIQPSSGRKTSCPVALLAVSIPVTTPRRSTNQRFAMTAASVTPIAPVASPLATPQSRSSCHGLLICVVSVELIAIVPSAITITRRMPNRS